MSADAYRKLLAVGLSPDQIAAVLDIVEEREAAARIEGRSEVEVVVEKSREQARERWHRWNDKRLQTLANINKHSTRAATPVEDNLLTLEIAGQEEKKKEAREKREPSARQHLEAVLESDLAAAVVEHRQRLGKPMTPRAGKLLAAKFAEWSNPAEAADAMIANGWQGFEPQWMQNRAQQPPQPRAAGPPKPVTHATMWRDEARAIGMISNDPTNPTNERLGAGFPTRPDSFSGYARRIAGAGGG